MSSYFSKEQFISKYQKVEVVEYPNNVLNAVKNPKVSLLLTTYNHVNYIAKSIESILAQVIPFEYEIIIGDDDSTDGTREICIAYAQKYPNLIRLFLHKRENNIKVLGRPCLIFQLSYNLFQARGKYLTSLSGDDYWNDPNKISIQTNYMDTHPECSVCYHEWAKLHDEDNTIEYLKDCRKEYPLPITWLMRNVFNEIPESMFNVLQEDDYMVFHLSTLGSMDYIDGIKPALYRVHANNTWTAKGIDFKRNSEIHTAIQLHHVYGNTKYAYQVKLKLYKSLIRYLIDKRTSKSYLYKFREVANKIIAYQLINTIIILVYVKWRSRIFNKINALKRKIAPAYIKLNGDWFDSDKPILIKEAKLNLDSGIYQSRGKYILNSFFGENKIKNLAAYKFTNPIEEQAIFCGIQHGSWDNYYHWYIDSLPRVWHLHHQDVKALNQPVKLYLSKKLSEEGVSILKKLLPDYVTLQWCEPGTLVKGKQALYLPFLSKDCSASLPKEYLDYYLQQTAQLFKLDTKQHYPEKIYISRKQADKRKFLNEDEVRVEMEKQGYYVLELEQLSIAEQAAYFYHAQKIVAQHGAALTNLLYTRKAEVVEIFHSNHSHLNHYKDLCANKGLRYSNINLNGDDKNESLLFDLNLLKDVT